MKLINVTKFEWFLNFCENDEHFLFTSEIKRIKILRSDKAYTTLPKTNVYLFF